MGRRSTDRRDISRDDSLRNADKAREDQDLKDGNLKGAAHSRREVRLHLAPELEGVGDHAEGLLAVPPTPDTGDRAVPKDPTEHASMTPIPSTFESNSSSECRRTRPTLIKTRLLVIANSELADRIQGGTSRTRPMAARTPPAIQPPPASATSTAGDEQTRREQIDDPVEPRAYS